MNPPYNAGIIDRFVEKLVTSKATRWCVLTNNTTEVKWAQTMFRFSNAACFFSGRVRFWNPGKQSGPPHSVCKNDSLAPHGIGQHAQFWVRWTGP